MAMKMVIGIPKEFEEHFNIDKFADSLARINCDIADSGILSGRYERELINMLEAAFANAEVVEDE